jgi:N-acetylneuraminic acid mutarotase
VTALQPENIGCWTDRASQPAELLDAGGAALGGKLYVVAGEADAGHVSSLYVYDPAHNTWTQGPDLPGPAVENPAAAAEGGKLYVFGGATHSFSGAVTNAAVFDPDANAWTTLPDLPSPRGQATAAAVGGKIYLIGGLDPDGASLASVDVFDPAAGQNGAWSSAAPMSTRRDDARAVALDGRVYVFGGGTRNADGTWVDRTLDSVEMYDPGTETWAPRTPMPTGRQSMAVGTLNDRAQVIGGEVNPDPPGTFAENEEYDPGTDSWRAVASMPTPRHGAVAGTIGGVVYVVGGGPSSLSSFSATNEAFSFGPFPGLAPSVFTGAATSLAPTAATLNGTVDPSGQPTTYHFEYGTDTSYGSAAPTPDGDAGSASTDQAVSVPLSGLEPDTTYHYRLVATNPSGPTFGEDETFHTPTIPDLTPPAPTILGKKIKLNTTGAGPVRVRCPATEPDPSCVGQLRLRSAHPVRFGDGRRVLLLGRRDFKIPSGESRRLWPRLSPSKQRLIAELGRLRVVAIATAHDLAGNEGVARHKLTLLAP